MPSKIPPYINRFSIRIHKFDKYNRNNRNNIDIDEEQLISSVFSEKAKQIINISSNITVEIKNPEIYDNNINCYLEYTDNLINILNVYKNNVLIEDYTFDNNSRMIMIPLTWNSSTYSIDQSETLDNIIIYIETDAYDFKINYTYN